MKCLEKLCEIKYAATSSTSDYNETTASSYTTYYLNMIDIKTAQFSEENGQLVKKVAHVYNYYWDNDSRLPQKGDLIDGKPIYMIELPEIYGRTYKFYVKEAA